VVTITDRYERNARLAVEALKFLCSLGDSATAVEASLRGLGIDVTPRFVSPYESFERSCPVAQALSGRFAELWSVGMSRAWNVDGGVRTELPPAVRAFRQAYDALCVALMSEESEEFEEFDH